MKLYISADIEGISGVVDQEHTRRDGREHDRARIYMTDEINACITGALESGVSEVVVNDSHGTMRNILLERLHPEAQLISGSPKKLAMVEGIDQGFDAAIFLGYHTMMGTNGVLNHTFHGGVIGGICINGKAYGEFGLNAAVAGHYNIPVVMVSGCNLLAEEATELIPEIHTAIVKKTINRQTALNLSTQKAQDMIKSKTRLALENISTVKPFAIESPIVVDVSFLHTGFADKAEILPVVSRITPKTVRFKCGNILDAYRYIRSLIMMVG